MRSDATVLSSIIEYCDLIIETVERLGTDEEDFLNDKVYQTSVSFSLMQIGELVKRLSEDITIRYPEMKWSRIAGMRDIIAHQYHNVNRTRLWKTINRDVRPLRDYCSKMLSEMKPEEGH